MCNDHSKSADMDDVKLLDHVIRDLFEDVQGLERNILGQVFIRWVL